jgi:AcrR family transcriptional regulator
MDKSMTKVTSRRNLGREDWVREAFDLLAKQGIGAISIDALASRLKITRGSFYHHFENRRDLLIAILEYWFQAWTLEIREGVSSLGLDPRTTLMALINTIRSRGAADYDAAIRAWALNDELAADYVKRADEMRLGFITELFHEVGFRGADLENRARLFLYYEAFEPMMFAKSDPDADGNLVKLRHELLTKF